MQELKAKLFDIIVKEVYTIITMSSNFEEYVVKTLESIAKALDIDRIYICEHVEQNPPGYAITFEYDAPGVDRITIKDGFMPYGILYKDPLETFTHREFIEHRIVNKNETPEMLEFMEKFGIKSILTIPINVDHNYWGFIVFNDCVKDRIVQEHELDYLKYVAFNIGAAIYVRRQHESIKKLNEQLEQALSIVQELLARNTKNMLRENEILKKATNAVQTS